MKEPLPVLAIHGAPRSGTSWLGQILNSHEAVAYRYQPMFAHAFKGRVHAQATRQDFDAFFADLLETQDDFVLQRGASALAGYTLAFEKSTPRLLAYKEVRYHEVLPRLLEVVPHSRLLGIVRDPRDVLASWVSAPREFRAEWSLAAEWREAPSKNLGRPESWYGFERWCELTRLLEALAAKHPARVRMVRYEDLVGDPVPEVAALFHWCGLGPDDQTQRFLARSQSEDDGQTYGVLRAAAQRGARAAETLPPTILKSIVQTLEGSPLARYLSARE